VPAHYYPTGLYHDGVLIPMCSASPLSPTTHKKARPRSRLTPRPGKEDTLHRARAGGRPA
jgi:hypothetical protein